MRSRLILTILAVATLVSASGCGGKKERQGPVYTDALATQLAAFAPNCTPVPGNTTKHIKETLQCGGPDGTQIGIRLTDGKRLWSMSVSVVAETADQVKPKLARMLAGIADQKALDTIAAHLDDVPTDALSDGTRVELDGVAITAGKRTLQSTPQAMYRVSLAWATF